MEKSLLALYHPSSSEVNAILFKLFMEEYVEFLVDVLILHSEMMICDNFNIQVNKQNNPEEKFFMETMHALGLHQYI